MASRVALSQRNVDLAEEFANRAVELTGDIDASIQKANCQLAGRDIVGVRRALGRLERNAGSNPGVWDAIGYLHSHTGNTRDSLRAFERAAALAPDEPHFRFNVATTKQALGDLSGAEEDFDAVIQKNPRDTEALLHRSRLRKQRDDSNHVEALEKTLTDSGLSRRGEVAVRFALAKEYEDLQEFDKSFEHLRKGANLRRSLIDYDVKRDVARIGEIIQKLDPEFVQSQERATNLSKDASRAPIFVVGLPRTGTTLVEQILSSHRQVQGLGELNDFAEQFVRIAQEKTAGDSGSLVDRARNIDFPRLGEAYLKAVQPLRHSKPYFVDKLPLNFLYLGLIVKALPHAKIVHVTRNPMDTCFAIYKTLFRQAYPYSYDFRDLATYYAAYRRLMDHWYRCCGDRIHTVRYESLVTDSEATTRELIEFCNLPWDEACLQSHKNTRATTTASLAQVRQPIYSTSVERWCSYEAHLQPLLAELKNLDPSLLDEQGAP